MTTDYLRCERCQTILGGHVVNTPEPVPCPACHGMLFARVFPAFFRPPAAQAHRQEALSSDEDAGCFFHPGKKAVVPCSNCGRFLCALCDVEIEDRHVCPMCLENSRGKADAVARLLNREHIRYDYQAFMLTVFPVFWFTAPITAPLALYYAVRYWNEPMRALIPRTHSRQVAAIILGTVQLLVWIGCFGFWYFKG